MGITLIALWVVMLVVGVGFLITSNDLTVKVNDIPQKVCWSQSLRLFIVVVTNNNEDRILTSPDGVSWTARSTPVNGNNTWKAPKYSAECHLFWVDVDSSTGYSDKYMTSPDGISWTYRTIQDMVALRILQ